MKFLIVGDVHFSKYSSILRMRGNKYSLRLENCIESVNWVEQLADETNCDEVVYLGDFFDKPELDNEEISALNEIHWCNKHHTFLCGNHEISNKDLSFNSANTFLQGDRNCVITTPTEEDIGSVRVLYIPYIFESERKPIVSYITDKNKPLIVFSHNDIKDFQMGQFLSKEGFSINEIDDTCLRYFNGHLHNGGKVSNAIINVGNLTGQNFSEDAFKYDHSVIVYDTDTNTCEVYENRNAFNFYKIDFYNKDIDFINDTAMRMKRNCVATIKCSEHDFRYMNARFNPAVERIPMFPYHCTMIAARIITVYDKQQDKEITAEQDCTVDHLAMFREYMINQLGNSDVLINELNEVCR